MEGDGAIGDSTALSAVPGEVTGALWAGTAVGTGGRQSAPGPHRFAASASGSSILLQRSELQEARWYFVPVRVT